MTAFRLAVLFVFLLPAGAVGASTPQQDLEPILSFESDGLAGWSGGPPSTMSQDSAIVRSGRFAGRLDRDATDESGGFSAFTHMIPRDFAGERLVLRGWLRTEDVTGFAGLWLRQDGAGAAVQFDNMGDRGVRGTTGWTEYTIDLPLDDRTRRVAFGALLSGEGTVWVDDLSLTVDGLRTAEAPPFVRPRPGPPGDTAFVDGSDIDFMSPSRRQVADLTLLGRVWGFVKYHHPRVRAGDVNWDYELFRVVPSVLEAPDREAASAAISSWLTALGEPAPCGPCATAPDDPQLAADVDWIGDRELLGDRLSAQLQLIHERRPTSPEQYYVGLAPGVGNPDFSNEDAYEQWALPDAGYRLLALYRFWNIIEYWFPYRDLLPEEWESVLAEFVPRVTDVESAPEYRRTMMELIARVHDTHANLWSHMGAQPPVGSLQLPVVVRFVEDQAVVTGYTHPVMGPASGLRVGDVIRALDGRPIEALVAERSPLYSASNETTRLRDIARNLTRGPEGNVRVSVSRAEGDFELTAERVSMRQLDLGAERTHDLPGPAFQRLSDEVAYLKLSSVSVADIPSYLEGADGADVLVVDIRNYPSEFVVFALGGHFVQRTTPHARFTIGDPANPGTFLMRRPVAIQPLEPYFPGTVAILVDETSLSQAEYTAMALRVGPNAFVAGSSTAGADGNVSGIPLPGGLRSMISGIGVFYPDGTPTQRVGIVPDMEVRPTIEGIRSGRDEVLEAAVTRALGREWRLENE